MATFQKTLDLWDADTVDAILDGKLKVQAGQWVRCGPDNPASRFVGVTESGTFYIAHKNGSAANQRKRFNDLKQSLKRKRSA